jgi:CheY-like chemotaxis protein
MNEQRKTAPESIGRRRVLVVDPDEETRLLYREALRLGGCEVIEAADGRDALTKALVTVPDLIISELYLPVIDGFSLCEILRRDRTTAGVPILIVTAEARADQVARARRMANVVLTKPTTPDVVLTECRRLRSPAEVAGNGGYAVQPPASQAARAIERRPVLAKSHARFTTTTPPTPPPVLTCPACDRPLKYEQSHIGGVSDRHPEQWDYYSCATCGTFQYRQRTRKMRRVGLEFVERDRKL